MKVKELIEQLNQLAKERPETLEMNITLDQTIDYEGAADMSKITIEKGWADIEIIIFG